MSVSHDVRDQIEKIDQQIVDLIAQRATLYQEAAEQDEEGMSADHDADTIAEWEGAADERGLNMTVMGNVCRGILKACRSVGE